MYLSVLILSPWDDTMRRICHFCLQMNTPVRVVSTPHDTTTLDESIKLSHSQTFSSRFSFNISTGPVNTCGILNSTGFSCMINHKLQ